MLNIRTVTVIGGRATTNYVFIWGEMRREEI